MAIPDYESIMLPLLKLAGDRKEHSLREAIDALAQVFSLTDDERRDLLPSGRQATFDNRVGWARTYLKKAGLLESTRRAHFQITQRGLGVLKENPPQIDTTFLARYLESVEFQTLKPKMPGEKAPIEKAETRTPEEQIEVAYQRVRENLATELDQAVRSCSPAFFEQLVVDLLVKMGYGGTRKDAGQAIGGSGDGGIDGIIKEDRLGLDTVYVQAKRWEGTVGRPDIQKFVGALAGQKAKRGVFITTSGFSDSARQYASSVDSKIVLIDGQTLGQLMMDFDVGVTVVAEYQLKRVDTDYFAEE
jgi:restriction system protein